LSNTLKLPDSLIWFFVFFLIINLLFFLPGVRRLGNLRNPNFGRVRKFFMFLFGAILTLTGILCYSNFWTADAYLLGGLLASWALLHIFSKKLMPARTKKGVEMLREIEGLRMYVMAEKEFLAQMDAPEDTTERYEKILPYAIALDAANKWNARFGPILEQYRPEWSDVSIGETLASLYLLNKRNGELDRFIRYSRRAGVASFVGTAIWEAGSGTSGGASGGGSGGGGGRGW